MIRSGSMARLVLLVAAATLSSAAPAADELPCTTTTAFGQTLGSTRVNGRIEDAGPNSVLLAASADSPPFTDIEVGISRTSKKIWGASAWVHFGNIVDARAFFSDLVARFKATFTVNESHEADDSVTLYTGRSCPGEDCWPSDGLQIELYVAPWRGGGDVSVSCDDVALKAAHVGEVLAE
jgi:hypothetical protein